MTNWSKASQGRVQQRNSRGGVFVSVEWVDREVEQTLASLHLSLSLSTYVPLQRLNERCSSLLRALWKGVKHGRESSHRLRRARGSGLRVRSIFQIQRLGKRSTELMRALVAPKGFTSRLNRSSDVTLIFKLLIWNWMFDQFCILASKYYFTHSICMKGLKV